VAGRSNLPCPVRFLIPKHAAAVLLLISAEAAIPAVEALPVAAELANGCSEMEKQHLLLVPGGKMPLLPAMLQDVPLLTCVDLPFEQLGQLAEAGAGAWRLPTC
jgi:hypothetical protein